MRITQWVFDVRWIVQLQRVHLTHNTWSKCYVRLWAIYSTITLRGQKYICAFQLEFPVPFRRLLPRTVWLGDVWSVLSTLHGEGDESRTVGRWRSQLKSTAMVIFLCITAQPDWPTSLTWFLYMNSTCHVNNNGQCRLIMSELFSPTMSATHIVCVCVCDRWSCLTSAPHSESKPLHCAFRPECRLHNLWLTYISGSLSGCCHWLLWPRFPSQAVPAVAHIQQYTERADKASGMWNCLLPSFL